VLVTKVKNSSPSEQYILSYLQKTSGGTPPLPPLVGIGLSKKGAWVKVYYTIAVFTDYWTI